MEISRSIYIYIVEHVASKIFLDPPAPTIIFHKWWTVWVEDFVRSGRHGNLPFFMGKSIRGGRLFSIGYITLPEGRGPILAEPEATPNA